MLKKIEQLRKQPKGARNRFAFWYAFLFTAFVAVFWVSSIPARVTELTGSVTKEERVESGLSRMWQSMKASVSESRDSFPSAPEEESEREPQKRTITAEEFIASSSPPVSQKTGKAILIGTSTRQNATSTPSAL